MLETILIYSAVSFGGLMTPFVLRSLSVKIHYSTLLKSGLKKLFLYQADLKSKNLRKTSLQEANLQGANI